MSENTATPTTLSPAAERMRRHRQRRRKGLQCIVVELRQSEIEALIRKKLLKKAGMRAMRSGVPFMISSTKRWGASRDAQRETP